MQTFISYLLSHIQFLFFIHALLFMCLFFLFKLSTSSGHTHAIIRARAFLNLITQQIPVLVPGCITIIPGSNWRQLTSYA